jgi:hypothetical protein
MPKHSENTWEALRRFNRWVQNLPPLQAKMANVLYRTARDKGLSVKESIEHARNHVQG